MGATKSLEFSVKENKLAKYAKALGHPARIAILNLLIQKQACICGDIVDELPLSQSTVSQHLKELKDAGLIKGDIDGKPLKCGLINYLTHTRVAVPSVADFFYSPLSQYCDS